MGRFLGPCSARCAITGKRCALPAHAGEHAIGRYRFTAVAAPGQTVFRAREELEAAAFAHPEAVIEESSRKSDAQYTREKRARLKAEGATFAPRAGEVACEECGNRVERPGSTVCGTECADSRDRRHRAEVA